MNAYEGASDAMTVKSFRSHHPDEDGSEEGSISQAIDSLERAMMGLEENINVLRDKMDPVMRSAEPEVADTNAKSGTDYDPRSQTQRQIEQARVFAGRMTRSVVEMQRRLDL